METHFQRRPGAPAPHAPEGPPGRPPAGATRSARAGLLWRIALLVVLVGLAYSPALTGGFIWDDRPYVTENALLTAPDGLGRIWFQLGATIQYYPLVFTTFYLERSLWGLNPVGYHVVNLLLHVLNAVLLWILLRRLSVPGAWLVALIFALHPVQVESVAWITQRKNVLSCAFALLSLLAFDRFHRLDARASATPRRWGAYGLAWVLFACALLSKTAVATLPVVILLILWWKRDRLAWRDVVPLAPFFALGLAMSLVTTYVERHFVYAVEVDSSLGVIDRLLLAGRALWFYVGKLIWPSDLAFIYPRWEVHQHPWWQYLAAVGVAGVVVGLWCLRRRLGKGPLAAALIFIVSLVPVLGFVDFFFMRYSFVADHYLYMAAVPLALVFVALIARGSGILRTKAHAATLAGGAALVGLLGLLTWQQAGIYRGEKTIWLDTVEKNPGCSLAHINLGGLRLEEGAVDEALAYYREGVRLDPNSFHAQYNLASLLQNLGNLEEAEQHYLTTLQLQPNHLRARANLSLIAYARGDVDGALAYLRDALAIDSTFTGALYNRGWILQQRGEPEEAIDCYERTVRWDPDHARAHESLAQLYGARGDLAGAARHWRELARIRPSLPAAPYNLGMVLKAQGGLDEAIKQFNEALRLDPKYAAARNALSIALFQRGDARGAMAECQRVLADDPGNPEAGTNLALMLLAGGRTEEAVERLKNVLRTHPEFDQALLNLGKVYCMRGNLAEGVPLLREALRVNPNNREARLALDQALGSQGSR